MGKAVSNPYHMNTIRMVRHINTTKTILMNCGIMLIFAQMRWSD